MEFREPERERLNRAVATKTHQSMIKSLLCELSGTLTADAAEGGSTLLRVRQRMDEIRRNRTNVHPGRTAVDARFAMGYSNDAYLNQPGGTTPWAAEKLASLAFTPTALQIANHAAGPWR